jgi:hypothetical protein
MPFLGIHSHNRVKVDPEFRSGIAFPHDTGIVSSDERESHVRAYPAAGCARRDAREVHSR